MHITTDILESFLQCRYKSYLQLVGEQGVPSEYERLLRETRARVRLAAMDKLLTQHSASASLGHLTVTPAVLKRGAPLVLDATIEDEHLMLRCDALQRVPGPSQLGDFHYIPVLCHDAERLSHIPRSLLALYGVTLDTLQGRFPAYGLLIHGQQGEVKRLPLSSHEGQARRVLQELLALQSGTPPRLMLNSHCPRCEFRQRCQAEALAKDDLSLLRGLNATEITKYNKRGIFTVTQLSCTFRPPKRLKTSRPKPPPHQPALQALALRDQKIYVHGTPQLPVCSTRIYLDLEGDPDRQFVYLLGMVVQAGAVEERYTFWADTPAEEARLYQQFPRDCGLLPRQLALHLRELRGDVPAADGQGGRVPDTGWPAPGARRECPLPHLYSCLFSHVLQWSQGHRAVFRLPLERCGGLRAAKYRVAETMGDHGCSGVQGHAHHLQPGGLSGPPDRDRVPL